MRPALLLTSGEAISVVTDGSSILPDSFDSTTTWPEVPSPIAEPQLSFLNTASTSATGQLSPAGITRTFAPPPNSACDLISFFAWHRCNSVSGFTLSKVVGARKDLPPRALFEGDE